MEIIRYDRVAAMPALPGLVRRVLAYTHELMVVHNTIQAGTVLPAHQHPHQQIIYIQNGEVRLSCQGEEQVMRAGDSCAIPGDVAHSVVALTDSVVLDIFTPARQDFIA